MRTLLLAAAALAGIAAPASALVQYDFTAISSFPFGADSEQFSGSFTYLAPTFIVPNTSIPVASLSSCAAFSNLGPATCSNQDFLTGFAAGLVTVSFGVHGVTADVGVFYYFTDTAFGTPGTYDTQIFGTDQQGTLVVTDLGGSVPEPASWALMIAGFGLVGGAIRRRVALAA